MARGALFLTVGFGHRTVKLRSTLYQIHRQGLKIFRHHADYGVRPPAEVNLLADYVERPTKPALPQTIAEHDDKILAIHLLFGREDTAEQRPAAHHRKISIAHLHAGESFRLAIPRQRGAPMGISSDFCKDGVLFTPIRHIGSRYLRAMLTPRSHVTPEKNNAFRVVIR